MKNPDTLATLSLAVLLCSFVPPALAGDGHDHGEAPPPATGAPLPRFAASSELFELVGVVDDRRLTVYLDHFADNRPVADASLELELDGNRIALEPHAEGEFEAVLERALEPGVVSVTATVVAGDQADLLAGELDIHEAATDAGEVPSRDWSRDAGWLVAGALALGIAANGFRRTRAARGDAKRGEA